ncbi:hypothetical protein [Planctomycetes bacterium TBK1r]|uniref:Uncharacterized protein n=1 Tax=Stieleria magnilauensis TaxID=2527963 RepID=A0ABX5XIE8_9BACT|nr:hypothetical protein TBK1r_06850 [Planctomycetes bacterium TBK1r]
MPSLQPTNLTAQSLYRGRGNPPSAHPITSISNCFPGLEFDFRVIWKNVFVGIEVHEAFNYVIDVNDPAIAAQGVEPAMRILDVDGDAMQVDVVGPDPAGNQRVLGDNNLEWTNALARIVQQHSGNTVRCRFVTEGAAPISADLTIRDFFKDGQLDPAVIPAGTLTQGLCSPWQADYRECGCYYWAASRPDFVNAEPDGGGTKGHNWMLKDRTDANKALTDNQVTWDRIGAADQISYEDLYQAWEEHLKFIIGGNDQS